MSAASRERLLYKRPSSRNKIICGVLCVACLAVIIGVAIGIPMSRRSTSDDATPEGRAMKILEGYPLIDGHNDLPVKYRTYASNHVEDISLTEETRDGWIISHTDIPKLRRGRVGAQFWVSYMICNAQYKNAVTFGLEQIDVIKRFVRKYPDVFQLVTSAQGILEAFSDGKIASLIALESGHGIDSSLSVLRMYYDLGVRYMTLTHNCNTPWADNFEVDEPGYNGTKVYGLTEFGKSVVREMNRIGMLVDLSHVAIETMDEALDISQVPVIFSHSSAFAICNHYRNVNDVILRKTKTNQGLVMINFYAVFVNCEPNLQVEPTLSQVADHIDYVRNLIGIDHVGIGADYEGVDTFPKGLENVSTYPALFAELVRRGWTNSDLEKLAGRNLIRVLKVAEDFRDTHKNDPVIDDVLPDNERPESECYQPFV